jgi:predicted nucleotidyltransferase component of viral defense system
MIATAEIARLAHRLGVGDRVFEKDYVLSWLLSAIAESELRSKVAFKGGTALKRCYYADYRFSEDLDFTLCAELSHAELVNGFAALFPRLSQAVNLTLRLHSAEQNVFESAVLLINYVGPLRARAESRHIKVDITRGELLLYPLCTRRLLAPYSDYPANATLPTYALEEILTEKLCAVMGRTEPRDWYDVYCLFEQGDVNLDSLPAHFAAKCRHKGQSPAQLGQVLQDKADTLNKLWKSRLAVQIPDLPDASLVLRKVRRHLRALDLI